MCKLLKNVTTLEDSSEINSLLLRQIKDIALLRRVGRGLEGCMDKNWNMHYNKVLLRFAGLARQHVSL